MTGGDKTTKPPLKRVNTQGQVRPGVFLKRQKSVWVFGYGSLLWKTNFPYENKVVGYIRSYARRFWLGNTGHRGVPGAPGRVVTLVKDGEESTWGIAFQVKASEAHDAVSYLNCREQGYSTEEVTFYPTDKEMDPITVLVYIGTERSSCYLGPASDEAIAKQVVRAKGYSGTNTEYVLNLASSMREIAPHVRDDHLYSLEAKVKELLLSPGEDDTPEDSLKAVSSL